MSDEEEIDAIAIFRPKLAEKLKPFLDLDEDEESDGLYAEPLEDGSFLVFTFQPYAAFEENEDTAREWLAQFGEALPDIHHDARGLLFFPDSCEPTGQTYDAVVAEVEDEGIWIASSDDDPDIESNDIADHLAALGLPGVDPAHLEQLAGQLLGDPSKAKGPSSFEIGRLFEGMQRHVFEALGAQEGNTHEGGETENDAQDSSEPPPPHGAPRPPKVSK